MKIVPTIQQDLTLDELIIEVTRRCNMACRHCLRGDAQDLDLDTRYVDKLFSQINQIYCITFSGGEPSLNANAIMEILNLAKKHRVEINYFYCATNGRNTSEEFAIAMFEWYRYCTDKDTCAVQISKDQYHEYTDSDDQLITAFKFCSTRGENTQDRHLIAEGRARNITDKARECTEDSFTASHSDHTIWIEEGTMYLNVHGQLISGCDWSYENQPKHAIGHADSINLKEWALAQETEA